MEEAGGHLDLSNTSLRTLPPLAGRLIKRLNASWNSIQVLWEEDLPTGLEELDMSYNELATDGLLSTWPDTLRQLVLSHNSFRSLEVVVHWPIHLHTLDLRKTQMSGTLPTNLPAGLRTLNVSDTHLTHIIALPTGLQELYATYTSLKTLPSVLPDGLTILEAGECALRNRGLPLRWNGALKRLDLHGNSLTRIPRGLPEGLLELNLTSNRIEEVRPIPTTLRILHLGRNRIRSLPNWLRAPERRRMLFTIQENCLTEAPVAANCLLWSGGQWVGPEFTIAALRIQRAWRWKQFRSGIRSIARLRRIEEELLAVAMSPERAGAFEPISSEWGGVYQEPIYRNGHRVSPHS